MTPAASLRVTSPRSQALRHRVHVGPAGVQGRVHVGELALDELELADRAVELAAFVHVGDHHVEARLHEAEGPRREHEALVVEAAHEHPRPLPDPAEHVLRRHLAVVEDELAGVRAPHPELVELLRGREPGHSLLDEERGEPAGARGRVGAGVDDEGVGVRAVRDPHLGAVEDEAVAPALGLRAHAHHVRARPRLAHRERPDVLAPDEGRKVAVLLLLASVAADLVDAQVRVRAVAQAHRGRRPAHLLHRDAVLGVAEPDPAVLLLDGDPEDAEVAHLGPEVGGEVVRLVDRRRPGRDLVRGEAHHAVADEVGLVAEAEVEAGKLVRKRYGAHLLAPAGWTRPKYAPSRRYPPPRPGDCSAYTWKRILRKWHKLPFICQTKFSRPPASARTRTAAAFPPG